MTDGTDRTAAGRSRREVAAALAGALATGVVAQSAAAAADATPTAGDLPPDFKVVFHVSDGAHWPYALSNVENLRQDWPDSGLRLVVDGLGVYALQGDSDVVRRLAAAAAAGLDVQVCPNALREHAIPVGTMPGFASTRLGGVAALVLAHREGFVYVKP